MWRFSPQYNIAHYDIYRRFVPKPFGRLKEVDILKNPYDPQLAAWVADRLSGREPFFLARIGGTEFEAATALFHNRRAFVKESTFLAQLDYVSQLVGYFDFDHDYDNFIEFLDNQASYYRRADALCYAGLPLLTRFMYNVFTPREMPLLRYACAGKRLVNYHFIELVVPFLDSFRLWGQDKRILIVSPFSESLQYQNARKNELIVGYQYPDFELLTYTSPLTWATLQDTRDSLGVDTNNWHEESRRIIEEISRIDFDVALLSCGSYAMRIGDFIRHDMGRKAVYVGGILNVFFNIYGERYDTSFYRRFMRTDTMIEAFENSSVDSLQGGKLFPSEAARAYFGRIDRLDEPPLLQD